MVRYKVIIGKTSMIVCDLDSTRVAFGNGASLFNAPTLKQLILQGNAQLIVLAKPNECIYCPFCGSFIACGCQNGDYTCKTCNRVIRVEVE